MREIKIVPFVAEHMLGNPGADFAGKYGPAYTFIHAGTIIASAGVTKFWDGCGEIWLVPSKHWENYKKEAVIYTRRMIERFQKEGAFRRLQAHVRAENNRAVSYLLHYGFEIEGLLKQYDADGMDAYVMARCWEVN